MKLRFSSQQLLPYLTILLGIAAVIGLTWANYRFVLQNPGGNDFLPRWVGTRLFLMTGQSPYSVETSREIQRMIFDRAAGPGDDQSLFVYPLYSVYVFAPFALIPDYNLARAIWMTTLEVALILIAGISLSLSRWQLSPAYYALIFLFAALWYHGVRPLINGNVSILIGLMIAVALLAIRAEIDSLASVLLALATIKPQVVVLLLPFVFLWAASRQRWMLVWGTLGVLGLLVGSMMLFIPNWLWQNLLQVLSYPGYTLPGTPGAIFKVWMPGVGSQLGWGLTIAMAGCLLWEWWHTRGHEYSVFLWTACLTLVITNLIGVRTATENFIALFPGLILVWSTWDKEWKSTGKTLIFLSYIFLLVGLWWLFLNTIQLAEQPTENSIMFFPLPVYLFLCLYWIRWWALRPESPFLNQRNRSRSLR